MYVYDVIVHMLGGWMVGGWEMSWVVGTIDREVSMVGDEVWDGKRGWYCVWGTDVKMWMF